jgi:hypothetical protein
MGGMSSPLIQFLLGVMLGALMALALASFVYAIEAS